LIISSMVSGVGFSVTVIYMHWAESVDKYIRRSKISFQPSYFV